MALSCDRVRELAIRPCSSAVVLNRAGVAPQREHRALKGLSENPDGPTAGRKYFRCAVGTDGARSWMV